MPVEQVKASILQLAIQGKLVPQDPNDEPASELLKRIEAAKNAKGAKKGKPLPPITDDEKPFSIPDSWEWVRLGEIAYKITDGTHKTPCYTDKGIRFVSAKDISSGCLRFENCRYISEQEHRQLFTRCNPEKGDLLVSKSGSIGTACLVDVDTEFSLFESLALVKFDQSKISSGYLKLAVDITCSGLDPESVRGVAVKHLPIADIKNITVPLPPFTEQQQIVAKVEALFRYVDECEDSRKQLAEKLAETLKRSVLQEAIQGRLVPQDPNDEPACELLKRIAVERDKLVTEKKIKKPKPLPPIDDDEKPFKLPDGWEWTRIGVISDVFNGNSINEQIKRTKYSKKCEGYSFIATPDVGFDSKINYESGVYIPKGEPKFRVAPKDSALMCIEGGSAARKFGFLDRDVMFGNKLCCFVPTISDARYIYWYLQSTTFYSTFSSNMTGIIGGVGPETLRSFLIPLPPLAEQKRIVAKVDALLAKIEQLKV